MVLEGRGEIGALKTFVLCLYLYFAFSGSCGSQLLCSFASPGHIIHKLQVVANTQWAIHVNICHPYSDELPEEPSVNTSIQSLEIIFI